MARPHPALIELAADRPLPPVSEDELQALVASAFEHRMAGLLWSRVLAGELQLPSETVALLAKQDLRSRSHALRLWQRLGEVQQQLAAIGVEVLVAKGVVSELCWYDRLGERPCNDLDLVLAPGAVSRVGEVVELLQPRHALRGSAQRLMSSGLLQSIDLDVAGIEVDLHADLLKFEIPTRRHDMLWATASSITGPAGVTARVLAPELALVHFLLHLNKDNFARLSAYADVARLLAKAELDWKFVDEFVKGEGLAVHVYSALHDVVAALGLPAAPAPRPMGPRALQWRVLWPERHRLQGRRSLIEHGHRQLAVAWTAEGRLPEAVRWWVRRRVLPPSALVALYYPSTSGSYARRLLVGRWQSVKHNRTLAKELAVDTEGGQLTAFRDPQVCAGYKTFPPRWSHIQVPVSSRAAARAAIALYSPCLSGGYLIRDTGWIGVTLLGPRAGLIGRTRPLILPVPIEQWTGLLRQWRAELGVFDTIAVHSRPQPNRTGFAVLLMREGSSVAFIRVTAGAVDRLAHEQNVLDLCAAFRPRTFWHPRAFSRGSVDGWAYLAMSPLPAERHVAARLPLDETLSEVAEILSVLPKADTVPEHWEPMHGDFTPWNCRQLRNGRRAVIDWEDAGWGPPGADDVLFRATAAALSGKKPGAGADESVRFWCGRISRRPPGGPRESIGRSSLEVLGQMADL